MTTYQIRDWNEHFENATSRERKKCMWVPMPNKQSGLGLSRILAEKDGAALYGIWVLIVGACSRQLKPRAGWLTDTGRAPDGQHAGTPWTVADLALMFRRPDKEVERALAVLSSNAVGWLDATCEVSAEYPQGIREVSADCPRSTSLEKEGRKEEKEGKYSVEVLSVFDRWCSVHWNGKGRKPVLDAKRSKLIAARLKAGYTVDDLCLAVDGCARDPFSMGDNDRGTKFNGLSVILRDAEHVDKFIALATGPAPRPKHRNDPLPGSLGSVPSADKTYDDPKTGIWRSHAITAIKNAGLNWEQYEDEELRDMGKGVTPYPEGVQ